MLNFNGQMSVIIASINLSISSSMIKNLFEHYFSDCLIFIPLSWRTLSALIMFIVIILF